MKILMTSGARNIAQSAQVHMRNMLMNINPSNSKSDLSNGLNNGQVRPKSADATKSEKPSSTTQKSLKKSKDDMPERAAAGTTGGDFVTRRRSSGEISNTNNSDSGTNIEYTSSDGDKGEESLGSARDANEESTPNGHVGRNILESHKCVAAEEGTSRSEGACSCTALDKSSPSLQTKTAAYNPRLNSFTLNSGNPTHDLKRFLDVIGTEPKEARYWFKYFQKLSDSIPLFAIVQIEEDVLRQSERIHRPKSGGYFLDRGSPLSELCSYLAFLQRHDMKCIIVHGRSADSSADSECLQNDTNHDAQLIIDLLEKNGAPVRQIGIPPVHLLPDGSVNSGWRVDSIDPSYVRWAESSDRIPILSNIGLTPERQLVSMPLFETTTALSLMVLPLKVLIVNIDGGIQDQEGKVIPNINLPHEEKAACKSPWCTGPVKSQIHDIGELLSRLQEQQLSLGKTPDSAVIITSCTTLLAELFTHYGSGTFFKITEKINIHRSFDEVDTKRLTNLIQMSFGKDLKDDFIESIAEDADAVFISEGYSAAAIITREPGISVPYLDKFVVRKDHQDNSVGRMIWEQIGHVYPALFWRSKNVNLINPWYFKRSEGSWSDGEWTVFWYGIQKHRLTSELIDYALVKHNSFKAPDPVQAKMQRRGQTSSKWSALKYM